MDFLKVIAMEPSQSSDSLEQMLLTLASLQGSSRPPLELIQTQIRFLSSKVNQLGQSRLLKLSSLGRKIDYFQSESAQELTMAYSFLEQTQKALQQSERECKKKLDFVMRQKLRKDIEINTYIDEQILTIVEQNQSQDIMEQMKEVEERIKSLKRQVEGLKEKRKKKEIQDRLKVETWGRSIKNHSMKALAQKDERLAMLKVRVAKLKQSLEEKLQSINHQHKQSQNQTLSGIEAILSKLKL